MRLMMAIGDQVIDSVAVEPHRCKQPGYLEAMQRCLKIKHLEVLAKAKEAPEFYLQVASAMHKKSKN